MSIFKASNLQSLPKFLNRCDPLAVLERKPKKGSDEFFQKLMKKMLTKILFNVKLAD